ncbi:ribosome assembly factor SBDS [Candidatus Woesearchaeota archaeon]|nr:ribosome assembly factor SBDS [Candidatus Woesearchaeota archaeon]
MSESMNLAKWKKGADNFEIVVNPDKAMDFKKGMGDIRDVLVYPKIFSDAKKGMSAPENRLKTIFGTNDVNEAAKKIIQEGEVQVTSEYRNAQVKKKKQRIINIIHCNGVDPRTKAPHPLTRVEAAIDEAKIKIDEYKSAEEQVQSILKKILPIIPIKFVKKDIQLTIPAQHAGKCYPSIKQLGKILKESWNNDGSWTGLVEIPGGMEQELYDKLNNITHGTISAEVKQVR